MMPDGVTCMGESFLQITKTIEFANFCSSVKKKLFVFFTELLFNKNFTDHSKLSKY